MDKDNENLSEALMAAINKVVERFNDPNYVPKPREPDPDGDNPEILRKRCTELHRFLVACVIESGGQIRLSRESIRASMFQRVVVSVDADAGSPVVSHRTIDGDKPWSPIFDEAKP